MKYNLKLSMGTILSDNAAAGSDLEKRNDLAARVAADNMTEAEIRELANDLETLNGYDIKCTELIHGFDVMGKENEDCVFGKGDMVRYIYRGVAALGDVHINSKEAAYALVNFMLKYNVFGDFVEREYRLDHTKYVNIKKDMEMKRISAGDRLDYANGNTATTGRAIHIAEYKLFENTCRIYETKWAVQYLGFVKGRESVPVNHIDEASCITIAGAYDIGNSSVHTNIEIAILFN